MSEEKKETMYSVWHSGTMYIHYDEVHQLARVGDMTIQLPHESLSAFLHTARMLGFRVSDDKGYIKE